ncbi:MAG: hypothetical protein QOG95_2207, partial [Mycobacterium sp.]|nr:hypothetical protein [Mycobacterium sp.]
VQRDEILRELEEHHHRSQTTARPSAPRGSAKLQPALRRDVASTPKRTFQERPSDESKARGWRKRIGLSLAAAAAVAATAAAVMLSGMGGTPARLTTPIRSSRLAAATGLTLSLTKFLSAAANAIANEDRQINRRINSPVGHHRWVATVRKRSTRHHLVTHATVAAAGSTAPVTSTPSYSSSSSTAASSSRPATNPAAAATNSNTSHESQSAFGQNGSLGPGRGAAGTQ